ncbi:MAG: hypothetical protein AAGG75_04375 [Bacteroidota bacterium]
MNLKPNLWTLLFLITAAALIYTLTQQPNEQPTQGATKPLVGADNEEDLQILDIDSAYKITKEDFTTRYDNYKDRYLPVVNNTALNLKDSVGIDTLGILAYTLKEYELDQIYEHYSKIDSVKNEKPQVLIYPVIKDYKVYDPVKQDSVDRSEFDLVFLIRNLQGNDEGFFDFTEPCPPICGDVPYINEN